MKSSVFFCLLLHPTVYVNLRHKWTCLREYSTRQAFIDIIVPLSYRSRCNKMWKSTEFTIAFCLREAALGECITAQTYFHYTDRIFMVWSEEFNSKPSFCFFCSPICHCLAKPIWGGTIGSSKSLPAVFSLLFKTCVVCTQFGSVFEDDKRSCTPRAAF